MVARRFLLPLLALLLPASASADTLEGSWALQVGGTAIFRFDLAKDDGGKWHGTWSKPSSFASDGNNFSRLKGPAKQVPSMTALETPDGIELSFNDPRPGAVPDKSAAQLGPWDAEATYSREAPAKEPEAAPEKAPEKPSEDLPAIAPGSFRLKPGVPVGR